MLLDFNTPGGQEPINKTREPADDPQNRQKPDSVLEDPKNLGNPGYLLALFVFSGVLSLSSLVLSIITIKNIPKPEPVSINCHPDLLKKIENQAAVLSEIAESAKK